MTIFTRVAEFLDTNLLLYAYDPSEAEKHDVARDLILGLARSHDAAISIQVMQEFYVNVVSKITTPLTPAAARDRLRAFARWKVHVPIPDDMLAASVLAEDHQLSFWDAMVVLSAAEMGCHTLWTEDMNHGQVLAGVAIRSPFRT